MVSTSSYPVHYTPTSDYNKYDKLATTMGTFFGRVNRRWDKKERIFIIYIETIDPKNKTKTLDLKASRNFQESTKSEDLSKFMGKILDKTSIIDAHDALYFSMQKYCTNLIDVEYNTPRTPPASPSAASSSSDCKTP